MGKFAVVEFEGSEITLSMVKWGAIRRSALRLSTSFGSGCRFVPSHELAIYEGGRKVVWSKVPYIVFYFADKKIAETKFEQLVALMRKVGISGVSGFMRDGDFREQGFLRSWDLGGKSFEETILDMFDVRPLGESQGNAKPVNSPADAQLLAPGTFYRTPDGEIYKR
jgi:hypothetical protein